MGSSFTSEQDTKGKIFKRIKVKPPHPPSKDFRSPPNPPNPLKRLLIPSKSPKDPQSREKTSDPLKISRRLPIPSKDFRSPQNPPNPAAPSPSRPRIITSRRHPLFFLFGLPTRPTTHTPHNTRSRGVENCGAPDQNRRVATGLARAYGFWVLRSSRQAGAGSRGRVTASPPTAVQRHTRILWRRRIPVPRSNAERRSLARVPEPTPQGRLRPITPRFAKNASLEASLLQKNRHNNFITPR